ncbi:MAG: pitrilysin family protein [Pseudomonadota bacterium]
MRRYRTFALLAAATVLTPPSLAAAAQPVQSAPVSALVKEVKLDHSSFKLKNGLTVLVHEDHKAPVVGFGVWYNVGSKDEPAGKTGFAHLFEHLMFYGSDNVREGIMPFLQNIGATDWNGTTWFDRTNYFETVPKPSLERALFMESDRMGYLLGAIDQKRLDTQRGVVQNEKREGDNQPGGLVEYAQLENLFPKGHPYYHSTIGSMADLDKASLATVKGWFIDKYGPNNAIVALSGDITVDEAKVLMEKYFGAIPRGPVNRPAQATVPTLKAPKSIVMKDRIPTVEIKRFWAVPGVQSPQLAALDLGASVLGGLASSRLDQILVREEKIATAVSADMQPFHRVGFMEINATVKPGVDPKLVEKRLDEVIADYIAKGPTADELQRASMQYVASQVRRIERVASQNSAIAEGLLYNGDSDFYKKRLESYASVTPAQARAAMQQWVGKRPPLKITLEPGERPPYVESKPIPAKAGPDIKVKSVKRDVPPAGASVPLDFPDVTHVTLPNGIKLAYAQRTAAPLTQVALTFDAGYAADAANGRGLENMVVSLLDEGTPTRSSQQIAEEKERLGAILEPGGSADRTSVTLSALSANLAPSLALMADLVRNPAFAPAEVERVRTQLVTAVQQARTNPNAMAQRAFMAQVFGASHPYGTTALGDEAAIKRFTRDDLVAFQQQWLRPDKAEFFVVSDRPLAEVQALLTQAFGDWRAPAVAPGRKAFGTAAPRPTAPKILLVDRPDSPQSVIYAGQTTPVDPRSDITATLAGSDVLGSGTFSRIFLDLRESKGWAYSPFSQLVLRENAAPYLIAASVQADRAGDSIAELMTITRDLLGSKKVTPEELKLSVAAATGELPGQFETSDAVLSGMMTNALYGRPDNYYELVAGRYNALTTGGVDQALARMVDPNALVFVVVGDAKQVRPQLDKLGMPIEVIQAP